MFHLMRCHVRSLPWGVSQHYLPRSIIIFLLSPSIKFANITTIESIIILCFSFSLIVTFFLRRRSIHEKWIFFDTHVSLLMTNYRWTFCTKKGKKIGINNHRFLPENRNVSLQRWKPRGLVSFQQCGESRKNQDET